MVLKNFCHRERNQGITDIVTELANKYRKRGINMVYHLIYHYSTEILFLEKEEHFSGEIGGVANGWDILHVTTPNPKQFMHAKVAT